MYYQFYREQYDRPLSGNTKFTWKEQSALPQQSFTLPVKC